MNGLFGSTTRKRRSASLTVKLLQDTEQVLRMIVASLPRVGSQEEIMLNLVALNRAGAIVHMLAEIGRSAEKIRVRIAAKEKWFRSLEFSDWGYKGLWVIDGLPTRISLN